MQNEYVTLSTEEQSAWRTILRAQANVTSAVDQKLTEAHGLGLSDYEVLSYLSQASEHSLRMTELAYGVLLSPSGLTRRLDGLVKQGYVERKPAPSDGRGLLAVLTQQGENKVKEMEPTHTAGLHEHFIDCLEPQQIKEINVMFEPMASKEEGCA
jgi:DNA-binding MarR family transcriptional regulator